MGIRAGLAQEETSAQLGKPRVEIFFGVSVRTLRSRRACLNKKHYDGTENGQSISASQGNLSGGTRLRQ